MNVKFLYVILWLPIFHSDAQACLKKRFLSKTEFNSQEIMGRFRQLSPDGSECGCMKAVILFTPGELLYLHAFCK